MYGLLTTAFGARLAPAEGALTRVPAAARGGDHVERVARLLRRIAGGAAGGGGGGGETADQHERQADEEECARHGEVRFGTAWISARDACA